MNPSGSALGLPRRDFVKSGSLAAIMAALGGVPITGEEPAADPAGTLPVPKADPNYAEKPPGPPVSFGVIGLGVQGREILTQLGRLPNAPVAAICDSYRASLKRASEAAPDAAQLTDYRQLLDNPKVQAVVVATPTPLHREIALAAMEAGKHVYLEAPMAHSIEDGRAIARAARALPGGRIFQVGLPFRENPQHHHVLKFFRTGACGTTAEASAQVNKKQSWRRASPNPEREKALNWRLDPATSLGLVGELGIHSVDCASWYQDALPTAVSGFGSVRFWDDGRTVPDTVQTVFDYPGGVRLVFTATLVSSFGGEQQVFNGSDATILIRDNKGWMFKEADAPLLGWEVYARKDEILDELGIALVANATKILAQGKKPAEAASDTDSPLRYALEKFIEHVNEGTPPVAGWKVGFESLVTVVRASEAVRHGGRLEYDGAMFEV